jgi:hypothetical protein
MTNPIRAALEKAAEFYIVDLRPEWRKSKSYPYITVWRPNDCGYAYALSWAGIYSKARVDSKPHYYANAKGTRRLMNFPVPRDVVESLSIPEPRSGLIDGNAGPVLPNTPSVRYALWRAAYRPKLAAIAKGDAITDRPEWPIDESPEDTLRRMIRICAIPAKSRRTKTEPRWAIVSQVTAHGSTYSAALCRWAGLDPDELVRKRP